MKKKKEGKRLVDGVKSMLWVHIRANVNKRVQDN